MIVDRRMIEPFNEWWRKSNHCEPDQKAVAAFSAGFTAGMERGIKEAREVINGASLHKDSK